MTYSVETDESLVFSTYVFRMAGHTPTDWESKGVAIAGYTAAVIRKLVATTSM